jgi:hypothetical protein
LRDIITLPPTAINAVEFDAREPRVVGILFKERSDPLAGFARFLPQVDGDDFITIDLRKITQLEISTG